jgi:hypothetical protein
MAISALEHDTLAKACAISKQLLLDIQPKLAVLAQIYDSAGGLKETLTQADLDELAALSGLTKAEADGGLYALTTVALPAIITGYTALAKLAARTL